MVSLGSEGAVQADSGNLLTDANGYSGFNKYFHDPSHAVLIMGSLSETEILTLVGELAPLCSDRTQIYISCYQ